VAWPSGIGGIIVIIIIIIIIIILIIRRRRRRRRRIPTWLWLLRSASILNDCCLRGTFHFLVHFPSCVFVRERTSLCEPPPCHARAIPGTACEYEEDEDDEEDEEDKEE